MKARVVVHLVNGDSVAGKTVEWTDEEFTLFKKAVAEQAASSNGWQVNLESDNGSWAVFPKQSVLYVELEVR